MKLWPHPLDPLHDDAGPGPVAIAVVALLILLPLILTFNSLVRWVVSVVS